MLKKRIIPCLDIKNGRTVKGVNFVDIKDAGDPVELAKQYVKEGADELVFLDITATLENRKTFVTLVEKIAKEITIPFTVGGGISTVEDAVALIQAGADKVSINSSAVKNPQLITDLKNRFGSQFVVVAIDTKNVNGNWKILKSYRYLETTNNASIVNSVYENFGKGDIPGVLALFDDNIVWNEAESNSLADGNPYKGPEAVLNGVFARLGSMYKSFSLKDIKLHEMSNNQVLATLYYVIEAKDGKKYDVQAAHHWTLKDGKIIGFQQYVDTKKLADSEKM